MAKTKNQAKKGKSICIICQKEKKGYPVRDDLFITTVRSLKQKLGIATNNVLVVCNDCSTEHKKRRSAFEKKILQYAAIGAVLGLIFLVISRSLQGLVMAILLVLFMAALALVQYHPASEIKEEKKSE
ncbi:hypothetical protein DRN67_02220 [Candidatus Micrarchaeota archaeon]|nr:MAG: hypothetical protein DRN67_02220 [Candidatus Micrarchaeota archaeon]